MSTVPDSWIAIRPATVERSNWSGDNVLFHGETGETHLLGGLPLLLFELLSRSSSSEADLIHACADHGGDEPELSSNVSRALQLLEEAELVKRIAMKPR